MLRINAFRQEAGCRRTNDRIAGDETAAIEALGNALAAVREVWEPETTEPNLRLVRESCLWTPKTKTILNGPYLRAILE